MALTRDEILGLNDIQVKEIEVPDWNASVCIRKLTRGQQDEYSKRRFGKPSLKQQLGKKREQEMESEVDIFGHDAWLVAQGVCDEGGKRLFTDSDVVRLNEKSGEAIGFIATEIVKFSGMTEDIEELEQIKN
jgi:hypothetical protein